jgi:hypothetical protein
MTRVVRSVPAALALAAAVLALGHARPAAAETPGAFPHIEPWPAGIALGGIPEALGEGIEAVIENPTGMLKNPSRGAAVSHASLFSGGLVRHQAAAVCWTRYEKAVEYDLGRVMQTRGPVTSAFGLGVTNLSGELAGDDSYGELQVSLAYARWILSDLRSGFRVRILQARSTVDGSEGGGYAFDLGIEGTLWGCRIGGVARALLSEIRWDRSVDGPIPAGFDLGLERPAGRNLIVLAGATLRDSWQPRRIAVAAAWQVPGAPMELRAGPAWRDTGHEQIIEISAGAGILIGPLSVEYGMRTGPPGLGEIHRFGLRAHLP